MNSLVFSPPDGKMLATGGADGTLRLWEVSTRREVATHIGHTGPAMRQKVASLSVPGADADVVSVAFSPDGNTLAAGAGNAAVLWRAAPFSETDAGRNPASAR